MCECLVRVISETDVNAFFFKQIWHIIKANIVAAITISTFFDNLYMYYHVNCTIINLIPKVDNPSLATKFRLISYCIALYKMVSKILMLRL